MDSINKEALLLVLTADREAIHGLKDVLPKIVEQPAIADKVIQLISALEQEVSNILTQLGVS
jgi:hypothetical protein